MKPELTPFEIGIIALVTQGNNFWEVGAKKGMSYHAIRLHIQAIYRKLGFPKIKSSYTNVIRLTHYAIVNGYIQAGQCLS